MSDQNQAASSRSEAGGWSGSGLPEHGDYVRPLPSGNTHIASSVDPYRYVLMVCGKGWYVYVLRPSNDDHPRQCHACREAM